MDCLRSFQIIVGSNTTVSSGDIATWGLAPQNYWLARQTGTSTFNIQGFKNINIFGIESVGTVSSVIGGADQVIVNDWAFSLTVTGINPLVGGTVTVTPNSYGLQIQGVNPFIELSRYSPKIMLEEPISSARTITITELRASGIGARNLAAINLQWAFNFVVYYKFEGE